MKSSLKAFLLALQVVGCHVLGETLKAEPMQNEMNKQAEQIDQLTKQISSLKSQLTRKTGPTSDGGLHLSIKYPGTEDTAAVQTAEASEAAPTTVVPTKTPLIIIAPKPLMSFNNLYEKMVKESQIAGSEANNLLKAQDSSLSNPLERIKILRKDEEEAAKMEAFYKADEAETKYATKEYSRGLVGRAKSFFHDLKH